MPDSGSDVTRLIDAAQVTLAEVGPLHDHRAIAARIDFAKAQNLGALALAVDHLAGAVAALVIATEEKP